MAISLVLNKKKTKLLVFESLKYNVGRTGNQTTWIKRINLLQSAGFEVPVVILGGCTWRGGVDS